MNDQLLQWVKEAEQAAIQFDNDWDVDAVTWEDIDHSSIVFEIGSFKGRWALQMAQRYNPVLYCFEPQNWAWQVTCEVLKNYNANVYNFGLGYTEERIPMGEFGTDGCSFVRGTRDTGTGEIRDIDRVCAYLHINHIDLCLINIEGFEYILLPYMMERNIKPQKLVIQFHDYDGNGKEAETRELLAQNGYDILWDYGTVLSAWERS